MITKNKEVRMVEHFVSCESYWSHWDSLYTLSEEELTSEEEGHRYQHYSRPQCHFCEVTSSCFKQIQNVM